MASNDLSPACFFIIIVISFFFFFNINSTQAINIQEQKTEKVEASSYYVCIQALVYKLSCCLPLLVKGFSEEKVMPI